MSTSETAAQLVQARPPGGPWFIELMGSGLPTVRLGPYENPSIARRDAQALQKYLTELLRQAKSHTQAG